MLIGLTITAAFNGVINLSKKRKDKDDRDDADLQLIKKASRRSSKTISRFGTSIG